MTLASTLTGLANSFQRDEDSDERQGDDSIEYSLYMSDFQLEIFVGLGSFTALIGAMACSM